MRPLLALLILLSACEFADTLDGHIDDQQHCCAAVTVDKIQECVIRLQPPEQEGWCFAAYCSAPIGTVTARQEPGGSIVTCEPD